jgi:mRNA deadenylase 3'-5' endonuclease subunit Ccr4
MKRSEKYKQIITRKMSKVVLFYQGSLFLFGLYFSFYLLLISLLKICNSVTYSKNLNWQGFLGYKLCNQGYKVTNLVTKKDQVTKWLQKIKPP